MPHFSQDNASITAVIPAMDRLSSSLDPTTKQRYHPTIIAAMKLAQKKWIAIILSQIPLLSIALLWYPTLG
jgi:hypothetical protein